MTLTNTAVHCYDIQWNTESDDEGLDAPTDLPEEVTLFIRESFDTPEALEAYIEEHGADLLSDEHSWLVESFEFDF